MNNYTSYTLWKPEMIPEVYNRCCDPQHFNADPDFYLMRIQINLFTLMGIRILASK
jgi:hypothetical protein